MEALTYETALEIATREKTDVSTVQHNHRIAGLAEEMNSSALQAVRQKRAKLESEVEKLEAQERAHIQAVAAWDRELTERQKIRDQMSQARHQVEAARTFAASLRENLDAGEFWGGTHGVHRELPNMIGAFRDLLAVDAMVVDNGRWETVKQAELALSDERLVALAREHKIGHLLPENLRNRL